MAIGMHNIKANRGARSTRKRVGRGLGSTGTYSGRGGKGQTARSGVSGLRRLGMKRIIMAQPKMRGFQSGKEKPAVVNVGVLDKYFSKSTLVNLANLKAAGLVPAHAKRAKILGNGEVGAALTIKDCQVSAAAQAKIEKAGGSVA